MTARRHVSRRVVVLFALLAAVLVLAVGAGATALYARAALAAPDSMSPTAIDVHAGESLDELATTLQDHGIVRSAFWFKVYARYRHLDGSLHVGHYAFTTPLTASGVVARLEEAPDVVLHRVVLAEGLTAEQMGQKLEQAGTGITAGDYLHEVRAGTFDEPFLAGRPAGTSLEGFLFPDTYDVPEHTSAHDFIAMQLRDFARRAGPLLQSPSGGLTAYQLVVLASIVEREAKFDDDRALVAGVLVNRLRRDMLLQVDASVLYGLHLSGQSPTLDQLKVDTPYNTYLHAGLPPTPIANPGLASLQAAAAPATTPDLFYVSDGCGHNHYSTTVAEHDRQVQQYVGKPC